MDFSVCIAKSRNQHYFICHEFCVGSDGELFVLFMQIHRFLLLLKTNQKRVFFGFWFVLVFGVMPVWYWVYRGF